eukprot:1536765-Pyramimonas_sp.AAC.1
MSTRGSRTTRPSRRRSRATTTRATTTGAAKRSGCSTFGTRTWTARAMSFFPWTAHARSTPVRGTSPTTEWTLDLAAFDSEEQMVARSSQ